MTVTAYLVIYAERHGDDTRIEDDQLTVDFGPHWVTISDKSGPCFAAPRETVHAVIRVDEEQEPTHE